ASRWSATSRSTRGPRSGSLPTPSSPMADPGDVTSVDDHLARNTAAIQPMPDYPQPLMEALGLAVAEDVVSEVSLPSFDNSGMDGYAVRYEDVVDATEDAPAPLP